MARYYFDVNDGSDIRDEIGREIDDPDTLRSEALEVVTERAAKDNQTVPDTALVLTVRDADGLTRLKVRLACQTEDL